MALLLVAPPVSTFAQSSRPSPGARTFSTSALATPTARAATTAELVGRINAMSTRPVPSTASEPVARPDMLWVPDRYVTAPGATALVLVPGHWERQLASGQVYVPPLAIVSHEGAVSVIPAGERSPIDQRVGP